MADKCTEPYMLFLHEMMVRIRKRRLSPIVLMESILNRIDSLEPSLQAWVTIDRNGLLEEAARQQLEITQQKLRGPLHGIPVGIKDIFYTAGLKTTGGSEIFKDFIPDYDANAVARLKAAGAIILGKTATTEFAFADPAPTRNPWNLDHTPGGSSSGSAAAVAARMCPAALGTQTGGSTLRPAAYCGVVGLKPTYGRISRRGLFPLSWSLDHVGILTRSVKDAAILFRVLADEQNGSCAVSQGPRSNPARKYLKVPRIGIIRQFHQETSNNVVWQHTEATLLHLERKGAQIVEVKMPESFKAVQDAQAIIVSAEAAAFHEKLLDQHRNEYRPKMRELIEMGLLIPSVDYLRAQRIRRQFRREMDEITSQFDCLLTPATPTPAPAGLSSTGTHVFQVLWSFSGLPAIALPSGFSDEGLPLGIQLVGSAFEEEKLFAVASWCEDVLPVFPSPKMN